MKPDATETYSGDNRNYVNDVTGKIQREEKGQSKTGQMSTPKMKQIKLLN